MDMFQTIFLGIIQGITEFFPVSSSAHLILTRYLFNWGINDTAVSYLSFDIALHFGTFLAIMIFFIKDWISIILSGLGIKKEKTDNIYKNGKLLWYIVIASIPGAIAGILFEGPIDQFIRGNIPLIAITLAIIGIIIFLIDKYSKSDKNIRNMDFKTAILIGFGQMLAIVPGFSRSGSTMAVARACGVNREDSAKFSFLLGAPIVFGSAVFAAKDMMELISTGGMDIAIFIVGIITSFVIGMIAIKLLLEILKRVGFEVFAIYRVALAVLVLIVFWIR